MNADELKAKWNEINEKLRQKWSQLSEQDWHQSGQDKDKIIKKVQEKYGIAKEQAEKEFRDLLNKKRMTPIIIKGVPGFETKNSLCSFQLEPMSSIPKRKFYHTNFYAIHKKISYPF